MSNGDSQELDLGKSLPLPGHEHLPDPVREAGRTGKYDPKAIEAITAPKGTPPLTPVAAKPSKKPELDFSKSIALPKAAAVPQKQELQATPFVTPQAKQAAQYSQKIQSFSPSWAQPGQILQDPHWYSRSGKYAGGELIGVGKAIAGMGVGTAKIAWDLVDMFNPVVAYERPVGQAYKELGKDVIDIGKGVGGLGKGIIDASTGTLEDVYGLTTGKIDLNKVTTDFLKHFENPDEVGDKVAQYAALVDGAYKVGVELAPRVGAATDTVVSQINRIGRTPAGNWIGREGVQNAYVFTKGKVVKNSITTSVNAIRNGPPGVDVQKFNSLYSDLIDKVDNSKPGAELYHLLTDTKEATRTTRFLDQLEKYGGLDRESLNTFLSNTKKIGNVQAKYGRGVFGRAYSPEGFPGMVAASGVGATWFQRLGVGYLSALATRGIVSAYRAYQLHPDVIWAIWNDMDIGAPPTPPTPPSAPPTPLGALPGAPGQFPGPGVNWTHPQPPVQGPQPPPAQLPLPTPGGQPTPPGPAGARPPSAPAVMTQAMQEGAARAAASGENLDLVSTEELVERASKAGVRPPGYEAVRKMYKEGRIDDEMYHAYWVHSWREIIERQRNIAKGGAKPITQLPKSIEPKVRYTGPERRASGETEPRAKLINPENRTEYYALKRQLETDKALTERDKRLIQEKIDSLLEEPFGEKKLPYDIKSAKKSKTMSRSEAEAASAKRTEGRKKRFAGDAQ